MTRAPKVAIDPKYFELAAINKIPEDTFRNRMSQYGWTPQKAATTPIKKLASSPWRNRSGPSRPATEEEIAAMEAKGIAYAVWGKERVNKHIESLGPDKGLEMHNNKGKQTSITAPQEKKDKFRRYYKKGGEW